MQFSDWFSARWILTAKCKFWQLSLWRRNILKEFIVPVISVHTVSAKQTFLLSTNLKVPAKWYYVFKILWGMQRKWKMTWSIGRLIQDNCGFSYLPSPFWTGNPLCQHSFFLIFTLHKLSSHHYHEELGDTNGLMNFFIGAHFSHC